MQLESNRWCIASRRDEEEETKEIENERRERERMNERKKSRIDS